MSGILGLVNFDGAPISVEELDGMRGAMAHWGPDGVGVQCDGGAAFVQCRSFDTPEAINEALPTSSASAGLAFTAAGRLDNREELFDALGVEHCARSAMPDGELMRLAYRRWGAECPEKLFGDWALAAWQPLERRLFLARDQHGQTSLYHVTSRGRLGFASDRRALLALAGVPRRLNDLYLARELVLWNPACHGAETVYSDICRLPPAHAMSVTAAGAHTWRYWCLEQAPDVRLATAGEYAEGLREHLRRAVKARLRSAKPAAVTLSAGLDSGAVAMLAARELETSGQRLTAVTAVPVCAVSIPGMITNEFELAAETARAAGNIQHVAVSSEAFGPLDGMERQYTVHGEPSGAAPIYNWLAPLLERVRDHVLLTGQGGNAGISWSGNPDVADVKAALRAGRIVAALKAAAWLGPIGHARSVCRHVVAQRRGGTQPWQSYSAIHPQFAERTRLREVMATEGYEPGFTKPSRGRERRLSNLRPGSDFVGATWAEAGAAAQVSARDPTMDARLLWFAVGVPNRYWRGPRTRWLIRDAMHGWLPDRVRLQSRMGLQASDIAPRMVDAIPRVVELLSEIEASAEARCRVDVGYMRRVLALLPEAQGLEAHGMSAMLIRGLAAGIFLARA